MVTGVISKSCAICFPPEDFVCSELKARCKIQLSHLQHLKLVLRELNEQNHKKEMYMDVFGLIFFSHKMHLLRLQEL